MLGAAWKSYLMHTFYELPYTIISDKAGQDLYIACRIIYSSHKLYHF